jgi:carbamoyltransferase
MKILGLNIGHNATAALLDDGRVVAAVQEERLSRIKNAGGIPALAIHEVLQLGGPIGLDQIDRVAVCGTWSSYMVADGRQVLDDYARMHREAAGPVGRVRAALAGYPWLRDRWKEYASAHHQRVILDELARLGINPQRVSFIDHHACHAAMAYYGYGSMDEKVLVLTNDGEGDGLCATVSIGHRGRLERLCEISNHHTVAGVYGMITYLMGMVPLEHEYKVMGLAPYGMSGGVTGSLTRSFRSLIEWNRTSPMTWRRPSGVPIGNRILPFLERLVARHRFDHIAAAVQSFTEEFLVEWTGRCVKETGIGTVCLSGGIFMNVKANQRILASPGVERLFIVPSGGDESNAVGAAYAACAQAQLDQGRPIAIPKLASLYWGGECAQADIEQAVKSFRFTSSVSVQDTASPESLIAGLLAEGKIVARVAGRMEFGARALGNRSLLANASDPKAPRILNDAVKSRDFWMPFAPSVLRERSSRYLRKPKPMDAPYMVITFDSEPAARDACRAAMHPQDFTLRPHEVDAASNSSYHSLLMDYEARTGHGLVLNTSFNLHGEPLVYSARDALRVFDVSGLQHLVLGNLYLKKT